MTLNLTIQEIQRTAVPYSKQLIILEQWIQERD